MKRCTTLFVLTSLALPVWAESATHWICGLSDDLVQLVCVADVDASAPAARPEATTLVRGTKFPLDSRRLYTVDLWSPPSERSRVEQLARAAMCLDGRDCEVTLSLPRDLALALR
jgi:hypothetical protein